jgi:putative acetyltransferase
VPESLKPEVQDFSPVTSVSSVVKGFDVRGAESPEQISAVRELFLEYAESLGFSLCFQSFDKELAELPGDYAPPEGRLLLATHEGTPVGCVALHKLGPEICEMKRLYVRPQFRGKGLGRALAERVIGDARQIGYKQLRLDTVEPRMQAAVAMYRQLGFREIASYRENPIAGALYMELELKPLV